MIMKPSVKYLEYSKDELLEANLVEKIWGLIMQLYAEIFTDLKIDMEDFIEIIIHKQESIEKLIKTDFRFLFTASKQVA